MENLMAQKAAKRLMLAAFFLAGGALLAPAGALTLSEIRTQVRRNLRDTSTDSTLQSFSNATILSYVNEAQKEINSLTWAVQATTSVALAASTTYYAMPNDFLAANQVTWNRASTGITLEIKETTERKVKQSNPDFEHLTTGPPAEYFTRYPTDGSDNIQMGLVPPPSTTSTGTMKVSYFCQPADLSGDSDTPFNGFLNLAPYHNIIVYQVTAKLKMVQGKYDEAGAYNSLYVAGMQNMNEKFQRKPNYNAGSVGGSPTQ